MNIKSLKLFCSALVLVFVVGCASTGTKVRYGDPGAVETLTADFGSTDLHMITEKMVNSLVMSPVLDGRPVIFVDDVRNKTHEHIDTKSITDKIRTVLLKHGKARITARSDIPESILKELDIQTTTMADPETIVKMGKFAGAQFILFGEISSIAKRAGRNQDFWYKITLNLANVQNGLIEWADDKEIRKVAKRRIIDW
ncbi:MAG: penicillin-binding protein activator LpoB [Candidatus Aminicenantes bacterium]|nr:MAG: penicillin-binding protein activator LpoB [Candidatus Aminicenantes bacterium]